MTTRVRLLQMIVLSLVVGLGLTWSTPGLSGQAQPKVALVIDDTGSMIEELPAARDGATIKIDNLQFEAAANGEPFPTTVIITFKDDVTTRLVSNDPVQLKAVISSLVPTGGGDCPESSLPEDGEFNLWTDADSRPTGRMRTLSRALSFPSI